jgi:hypothetical protein
MLGGKAARHRPGKRLALAYIIHIKLPTGRSSLAGYSREPPQLPLPLPTGAIAFHALTPLARGFLSISALHDSGRSIGLIWQYALNEPSTRPPTSRAHRSIIINC